MVSVSERHAESLSAHDWIFPLAVSAWTRFRSVVVEVASGTPDEPGPAIERFGDRPGPQPCAFQICDRALGRCGNMWNLMDGLPRPPADR
jgi:hypothetical protein